MAVFKCRVCGQYVPLTRPGYADPHTIRGGRLCTFTRTPADPRPVLQSLTKTAAARRVSKEGKEGRAAKCPACRLSVRRYADGTLHAHRTTGGAWCAHGRVPTEADIARALLRAEMLSEQKPASKKSTKKTKTKRSVWTISGGLPGLGRHS